MSELDRYLPNNWLVIENGVAQLSAAVVLSPGVSMEIGGDVKEVKLAGGPKPSDAASIYTGSGKLRVHDVTISSYDPASSQPLPIRPGCPFVVVSSNGQMDAVDATFADLAPAPARRPGRRAVRHQQLRLDGAHHPAAQQHRPQARPVQRCIRLEALTVNESAADGLVLRGDKGTALIGIKAERNGANGVLVTGESTDRPITGISTTGNGGFGVAVVKQTKPRINGIVTNADGAGGLRVSRSADATVTDVTATRRADRRAHPRRCHQRALDQLKISNSRRGVVVDKSVTGVTVRGSAHRGLGRGGHRCGRQARRDQRRRGIKDSGTGPYRAPG